MSAAVSSVSPPVLRPFQSPAGSSSMGASGHAESDPDDAMEMSPKQKPRQLSTTSPSSRERSKGAGAGGDDSATESKGAASYVSNRQGQSVSAQGGASAAPGNRVVQKAFVQKLYNMLEDDVNKHVISWSRAGDSFFVNPGPEFQNVLASFFKHTNPQSFVRQLNMYGFHKVNDAFQGASQETHLWEFKHGEGSFRQGDVDGLREIKRRPSRHHLAHRELTAGPQQAHPHPPQQQLPQPVPQHSQPSLDAPPRGVQAAIANAAPPMPSGPSPNHAGDSVTARLEWLERSYHEMQLRVRHADDMQAQMAAKCASLQECLFTSQKTESIPCTATASQSLTCLLMSAMALQSDIERSIDRLARGPEQYQVPPPIDRRVSIASSNLDSAPISPHVTYDGENRRGSYARAFIRPAAPSRSAAASPRRLASVSRNVLSPPPATALAQQYAGGPAPAANMSAYQTPASGGATSPNSFLSRRHTSADIRDNPGWRSGYSSAEHLPLPNLNRSAQHSPLGALGGASSGNWPSSPHAASGFDPRASQTELQLRESLGRYQIDSRNASTASDATVVAASSGGAGRRNASIVSIDGGAAHTGGPAGGLFAHVTEGSLFGPKNGAAVTPGAQEKPYAPGGGGSAGGSKRPSVVALGGAGPGSSAPGTRRSSVAHLLNPDESAAASSGRYPYAGGPTTPGAYGSHYGRHAPGRPSVHDSAPQSREASSSADEDKDVAPEERSKRKRLQ